ncbi:MAG: nuclear transport factor 2 family protein [Solirubrobacterales bacterium]
MDEIHEAHFTWSSLSQSATRRRELEALLQERADYPAVVSAENVKLVRRWFEGFRVGEVSPDICDPEIEIRNWKESPSPGPYRGHEGLRRWWNDVEDAFEDMHFELVDAIDVGDERVVTVQRIVGRFRLTGIEVDHIWGAVVSVRQGKIASAVGYASPGRAKRAAGLAGG